MRKQRLFLAGTLLAPLIIVGLLEICLRLFGYGSDLELVIRKEVAGREFYAINRAAGARYFPPGSFTPEPHDDLFEVRKQPGTLRIFCIGESTMAGFPYEYTATAPAILRSRLETGLENRTIEVVNVGMAAVTSVVVLDVLQTLLEYEPDLFIVYVGHNEFYGAFGVSSGIAATRFPWLTDLSIYLLRYRTFLLLRDIVSWILTPSSLGTPEAGTLMEHAARNEPITEESPQYGLAHELYVRNIRAMITEARSAGVPILISAPVSNVADFPPFLSYRSAEADSQAIEPAAFLGDADRLAEEGYQDSALSLCKSVIAMDSSYAAGWFRAGQFYRRTGRIDEARSFLERARDLDGLRFRMSSSFMRELTELCRATNTPLVRIDSAFASASADRLPGQQLILEHVHPNIRGYRLMADTWVDAIRRIDLPASKSAWLSEPKPIPFQGGITEFDNAVGRIRVYFLMRRWPFTGTDRSSFVPSGPVEEIAYRYIRKEIPWQTARYEMAALYVRQQAFELARREAYAVSRVLPFSYEPLLRIGDYYLMEGLSDKAIQAYKTCIEREANPFAYAKMALIHLQREDYKEVLTDLGKALELHEAGPYRMPDEILASNYYLSGYAFIRTGDLGKGKESLRAALRIKPQFEEAEQLLRSIDRE